MAVPFVSITANELRHRWLVAHLAADPRLDLRGVVCEQKGPRPEGGSAPANEIIASHFRGRDEAERRFFGDAPAFEDLGVPVNRVPRGASNDPAVAQWVDDLRPERLSLFGCSIIREPLLATYEDRTINLHLGLSPYYRGAGTNFWPLVNGEPECVGATIHIATLKVDAGPILVQRRPEMTASDGPHEVGFNALIAGASALRDAVAQHAEGVRAGEPQQGVGRLYKNADFGADAVVRMREQFANGMVKNYLQDKERRDGRFPIVG